MHTPMAVTAPALMIVAKAVAGVPTWTERLDGRTDAKSGRLAVCVLSKAIADKRSTDGPSAVSAPVFVSMVMSSAKGGFPLDRSTPKRVPAALNAMAGMLLPDVPSSVATVVTAPVVRLTMRSGPSSPSAARKMIPLALAASAPPNVFERPDVPTLVAAPGAGLIVYRSSGPPDGSESHP